MPREAASSSAGPFGSSSSSSSASAPVAGPGPSTAAARTTSSGTSATSSARSSPANDLFRISLPDSPDVGFGTRVHLDPVVDAVLRELTEEGRKRFQDMLEQASSDLKARLALLDSDDKKERKRLFDEFVHNMHEIALMQEHEVQAHVREEVLGKGSSGFSSASRSTASSATTSTFSTASTLTSTVTSSSSAQASASSAGAAASGVGPRISNSSSFTQNTNKDDDSSDSEEETDRPQPLPRNAKSNGKTVKSKFGKQPPSLNTAATVNARNPKPSSNTSKKVTKDDDQSSSPSTPTPSQVRRGRSGTISLPHSVSTSSAFPDDTSSASSHAKSKSFETASAKQSTDNNAEIAKQKAKGSSKSATSSPFADSRPELAGNHGVSSASGATSSSAAGTAKPTNVATKAAAAASQNQSQKLTQQRPVATAPQPPAPSRGNSSSNVNTAGAKKGNVQQAPVATPSGSNAAIASPLQQAQTFQYAQAQIAMQSPPLGQARAQVPQSQSQIHSHAQAQMHSQPPKLAQDDSILGIRPKESGNSAQGVNHKLWIPPKPPHMQSPGQSAHQVHTVSSSSIASTTVAMKDPKDAKDGTVSKDSKEKKPRPVSFASLSNVNLNDVADGSAKNSPASTARALEKGDRKGSDEYDARLDRKSNTSGAANITSAPTASPAGNSTLATALHSSEASSSNSTETVKGAQPSGTPASPKGMNVEVIKNNTSSPKATQSSPQLSNSGANVAPASIPSTPLILTPGLSSASSSEAATADMERERLRAEKVLRAEKAYLLASQSVTISNGKTQPQTHSKVTQPHAHLYHPAYNPTLQPQSHQKSVAAETINAPYLNPYSLGHSTANANASTGVMTPSTSGSTITSPFSPLSMANGFLSSSAATSAASSRAISRHASSSSADPYAQKDSSVSSHVQHAYGHHRENNKEKDKLAREAAAVLIAPQSPAQANMFWQPNPNEREREQRERERRDRNHLRAPSANDSSASASAASSRSSSVSRHDALISSGFDPSTIRPTGRSAQIAQQSGSGGFNPSLDGAFASFMEGGPNGLDRGASSASGNAGRSGHETKIWLPGQAKDTTPKAARRGGRERDAGVSASSPPINQLALTISSASTSTTSALVPLTASTASSASTPQAEFYAAAERAREERLRERSNECRSRAEVISFFRRRFDALMGEFMEAMMQADDYEKFGPTSAVPKQGLL